MPLQLADLLNYVLQLDAGDRQQAQLDLQTQQQHLGNLNQFIGVLAKVQNPQELNQLKAFFASNGVPQGTLDQVAQAYVPSLAQQADLLAQQGTQSMTTDQRGQLASETAAKNATGMSQGQIAESQATASEFANPDIFGPTQQRAHLFSRIGYDPGKFALSEATAAQDPATIARQAAIAGGTDINATNMADLLERKREFEIQSGLALKQFNEGIFQSDRNYSLQFGREAADQALQNAQIEALRAKAQRGDPEAIKELRTLMEDAQKGGSKATQDLFKQMIENQAKGIADAQGKPLFRLQKDANYSPSFWEKHF